MKALHAQPGAAASAGRTTAEAPAPPIPHTCRISDRARRIRIQVNAGGVVLVVPRRASLARATAFLHAQEDWVRRQWARTRQRAAAQQEQRMPDGTLLLGGQTMTLDVQEEPGRRGRVRVTDLPGRLLVHVPPGRHDLAKPAIEQWLRIRARSALEQQVRRWAPVMNVRPLRQQLRDQRTRWGSCSRRGNLSFNWRIIMAPPEVLDYLVIHELAHLAEHNHGPRFWRLVEAHCPDFRTHKKWLRQHAGLLFNFAPHLADPPRPPAGAATREPTCA
jgi:predicted metal-dependent hydrolase